MKSQNKFYDCYEIFILIDKTFVKYWNITTMPIYFDAQNIFYPKWILQDMISSHSLHVKLLWSPAFVVIDLLLNWWMKLDNGKVFTKLLQKLESYFLAIW